MMRSAIGVNICRPEQPCHWQVMWLVPAFLSPVKKDPARGNHLFSIVGNGFCSFKGQSVRDCLNNMSLLSCVLMGRHIMRNNRQQLTLVPVKLCYVSSGNLPGMICWKVLTACPEIAADVNSHNCYYQSGYYACCSARGWYDPSLCRKETILVILHARLFGVDVKKNAEYFCISFLPYRDAQRLIQRGTGITSETWVWRFCFVKYDRRFSCSGIRDF